MRYNLGWEAAFYYSGLVSVSRSLNQRKACSRVSPHISSPGCKPEQQVGRSARPKIRQRKAASRCRQGSPAGLFSEEIDGAMQQAPQPGRQAKIEEGIGREFSGTRALSQKPFLAQKAEHPHCNKTLTTLSPNFHARLLS
jgi:hypothetical protein